MEDVLDELKERNQDVPVPLELPELEQLIEVEEQILMPLPPEYKEFLMLTGDVICGSLEPCTAADEHSHTYLAEVTANAWEQGLSRELIPVCETAQGFYCIDQEGEISFWPEFEEPPRTWESIWHWARDVWLES